MNLKYIEASVVKISFYGNLGLEELTILKSKRIAVSKGNT